MLSASPALTAPAVLAVVSLAVSTQWQGLPPELVVYYAGLLPAVAVAVAILLQMSRRGELDTYPTSWLLLVVALYALLWPIAAGWALLRLFRGRD